MEAVAGSHPREGGRIIEAGPLTAQYRCCRGNANIAINEDNSL